MDDENGKSCDSDCGKEEVVASTDKTDALSKRQMKKLKRKERVEKFKRVRRKEEKLKRKKRKLEAKEKSSPGDGVELSQQPGPSRKQLKSVKMATSLCKLRVAVDMSFDRLMSEKDLAKTLTQLQYCYSANRRADNPLQFYIAGFSGGCRRLFDKVQGCKSWDVYAKTEDYLELFEKSEVCYLTSDSPNVLETLADDKIYVIGGLVDHNHHKNLCYRLAVEKDVAHARLPIDEYVRMNGRQVLTINHVFEILLRYAACKDWKEAFFRVIPKRKGIAGKDDDEDDSPEEPPPVVATAV